MHRLSELRLVGLWRRKSHVAFCGPVRAAGVPIGDCLPCNVLADTVRGVSLALYEINQAMSVEQFLAHTRRAIDVHLTHPLPAPSAPPSTTQHTTPHCNSQIITNNSKWVRTAREKWESPENTAPGTVPRSVSSCARSRSPSTPPTAALSAGRTPSRGPSSGSGNARAARRLSREAPTVLARPAP